MRQMLLRQILVLLLSFVGITLFFFSLTRLIPGDPVVTYYGNLQPGSEAYQQAVDYLGVEKPVAQQYFIYLSHILAGDLGRSTITNETVLKQFLAFFPATIELGMMATAIALIFGILIGIVAALKKNTWVDHLVISTSLIGYSMPVFWWGMLLIFLFSLSLGWTPVAGRISFVFDIEPKSGFMLIDTLLAHTKYGLAAFFSALKHLLLPSIVLATIPLAVVARITRSSMIEVLNADYMLTAKAKGVPSWRIIWVHGLRNALIPVVTVIGLQSSILLTGAILTETIFAWPGVGKWMVEAIYRRDIPTIQGGVLMIASFVIVVNVIVDLLYGIINPRLRKPV